jgi:hypothetical protein
MREQKVVYEPIGVVESELAEPVDPGEDQGLGSPSLRRPPSSL